jgi:hypothetical protein
LAFRDLDVLDDAVDVGELEPHEMNLFLLGVGEDLGSCFWHGVASRRVVWQTLNPKRKKVKKNLAE